MSLHQKHPDQAPRLHPSNFFGSAALRNRNARQYGNITQHVYRGAQCQASFNNRPGQSSPMGSDYKQLGAPPQAAATDIAHEVTVLLEEPQGLEQQLENLKALRAQLCSFVVFQDKIDAMLALPRVQQFLHSPVGSASLRQLKLLPPKEAYCLLCLAAIGQEQVLMALPSDHVDAAFLKLSQSLAKLEDFYDCIGGLIGYQLQCVELLAQSNIESRTPCDEGEDLDFMVPIGLDIINNSQEHEAATAAGIAALPSMAEIYPLGGAGDRLGLCCEDTGDSLPTAVLPYCGRSLLEALIRDLQAREYLHYRLHGEQHVTPVAVMTSAAKGNHWRVNQLFETVQWFGRGRQAFNLFQQPLVPVVTNDSAQWLVEAPLQAMMKPGGHGVMWKLMLDQGVFGWLSDQGRTAAIVRQISNPMAGQDTTLLALAGEGHRGNKSFGFASCERVVGAAEGMNVIIQKKEVCALTGSTTHSYHISNVEYTEFERLGIEDKGCNGTTLSQFPANTNVLYVGLPQVEGVVRGGVSAGSAHTILPGTILNTTKEVCYRPEGTGPETKVRAGRLECTMQNLADEFGVGLPRSPQTHEDLAPLSTFMVYGPRRKVTSSAKRKFKPGSTKIHQTPDGSFYDLMRNAQDLLTQSGVQVPDVGSIPDYLASGPGFIFLFHPALGPLWDVIAQKIKGGEVAPRSEVQLEVAEASWREVKVDGSLLVLADAVMGHTEHHHDGIKNDPRLVFSHQCGRVRLHNVSVVNAGVNWEDAHNVYWRHKLSRHETCRIVLHGRSEFDAQDVELRGNVVLEVPDGHRMTVRSGADGQMVSTVEALPEGGAPTWSWVYSQTPKGRVCLELQD